MRSDPAVWIAFLRGMNLGRRRLTNDELVFALDRGGFKGAEAYQASGNVVFDDDRTRDVLEPALGAALERELGYSVPVFLRSGEEVRDLAESAPFRSDELAARAGKRQVILLRNAPSDQLVEEIMTLVPDGDLLVTAEHALHWLPAGGLSESDLDLRHLDRLTGGTTIRTHGTIRRLSARFLEL